MRSRRPATGPTSQTPAARGASAFSAIPQPLGARHGPPAAALRGAIRAPGSTALCSRFRSFSGAKLDADSANHRRQRSCHVDCRDRHRDRPGHVSHPCAAHRCSDRAALSATVSGALRLQPPPVACPAWPVRLLRDSRRRTRYTLPPLRYAFRPARASPSWACPALPCAPLKPIRRVAAPAT